RGDVGQSVDLCGDVVADEHRRAVPEHLRWIGLGRWDVFVFHAVQAVRTAECQDLTGAMPWPLVTDTAVGQAQVEHLSFRGQSEGRGTTCIGHRVQAADLIVWAPDPSPADPLPPTFLRIGSGNTAFL